ncbi:TetR/AcrR family transcriptional regulator [Glycomyces tarimensis]
MSELRGQICTSRERTAERRQAVLSAAFELLGRIGFEGLTVQNIAERSGMPERDIRERWPSIADLLLEAVIEQVRLHVPVPDEGSLAADVRAYIRAAFTLGRDPQALKAFRAVMEQAKADAAFGRRFNQTYVPFRRGAVMAFVERGAARGELPAGAAVATAADLILGTIWSRALENELPLDERFVHDLTTVLTGTARP